MRILFLARHHGYFRNYESVLRTLAERGHALHLAVERDEEIGGLALVSQLAADFPHVTFGEAPTRADDEWQWIAGRLRLGLDYLRYQHPVFDQARKLRSRARERTPGVFVALGAAVRALGEWSRRVVSAALRQLERAVPVDSRIERYVESHRPDAVLITPLIDLGSSQIDYLRAARALGVPTALCVWSWDHLSSKALIRESPDRVFVWNDTQKDEAIRLHDIDPQRIIITGAQCFDQWFDRTPSRDRDVFCRERGLDPARPLLLYVCSALFAGSPVEAGFVLRWAQAIRESDSPVLCDANILVRPHPSRMSEWESTDAAALGIVVWGRNPIDASSRADYFDSLYHSDAVTGLNTSAFIEAGILGRPVHTIVIPEFAANQTGTVHFRYLTSVAGGLLNVASDFDEHLRQLQTSVTDASRQPRPFVQAFVRPHGLDVAATPVFVDEVEQLPSVAVSAVTRAPGRVWRTAVAWLSHARTSQRLERWTLSWREFESVQHARDEQQRKAFRRAEERAGSDQTRLSTLRSRAAAFEQERLRRQARQQRREQQWAGEDAELLER
jgi:hypothetical protein